MKKLLILCAILFTVGSTAQEIKFGKVSKQELEETSYLLDATADAAYLFKKRETYFRFDQQREIFLVETEYHDRIKIYTKEGLDYATKKINYYNPKTGKREEIQSLKAYVFNLEDGKVAKTKLSKKDIFTEQLNKYRSQKKITFPNVKEGSIIDFKYRLSSPYGDIKTLNFQYEIPVVQLDYRVKIPEYYIFNKTSKGFYNVPIRESSKRDQISFRGGGNLAHNAKIYKFTQKNIPALKDDEPYSGNLNNYRGGMEFELAGTRFPGSTYKNIATTWKDVCKTIYESPSFGDELKRTNHFKNDLLPLIANVKNDFEKTAMVFQFVKSKIKWNEYHGYSVDEGVKKAYKEGVGNVAEINLNLTSMLRAAGLNANPVLVSTRDHGVPLFPTRDGFNYVITKVNYPSGSYILLDATDPYSFFNTLPFRALNWYGRELLENGFSREVKLVPSKHATENNILNVKIDDLGEAQGMYMRSLDGHVAMFSRQKNNLKKEEDLITAIEEKHNIEIEDFKISNKDNLSKSLTQRLKFTSEDLVEEINGKLYFSSFLFLGSTENPFKSEKRNFPIEFGMPWKDKFSIAISIPNGYTVESYPKELAIGLPDNLGFFKYKALVQGNKIKISAITQLNTNMIAPQYYTEVKEFYKQMVEKQTEKIVLVKSELNSGESKN
ncbi:Transglutaminase-like superfamily protein [Tenacibaculum sp. 190130A14a]|uniref:Transglutaminase-like superfamily protein n=1 Tax=Tenacibaculum polynesiense TaxID=3137857 RepID=A0ABP1F8D7_9FLAO